MSRRLPVVGMYGSARPTSIVFCCRNLFQCTASLPGTSLEALDADHRRHWYSEYNVYRATMYFSLVASVAIIAGLPRPVFLVLVASALAYFVAPVIFFLNLYYCFKVIPRDDPQFYPSRATQWFSWTSLGVFTGMSILLILQRIFDVAWFRA